MAWEELGMAGERGRLVLPNERSAASIVGESQMAV